ncbi:MAG TPA: glycosyltransferase [Candidatus Paceibacterota bacterium]|nr:glycosyltransferase [Candidatus Paceibacterota bacterium]
MNKIPCTVGILTLNSADGLPACLESLKDFAEIVVCDGNSTDQTVEIAKKYGARVIKQYESDRPNLPCIKDKAGVREKNMAAASYDWYFFMDADDTLSPEAAEEIRKIVSDRNPDAMIYRMPTRIFINNREIKHEATYPSFQIRLVNRTIDPHFKGRVHDRLVFDAEKYNPGQLKSYYNFHWSEGRVRNFWPYLRRYSDWEIETAEFSSFRSFLYWAAYRRLRTLLGYVLYRLPMMYGRYGFKDSMPLSLELVIVRYHSRLFIRTILKYMTTLNPALIIREVWRKKDMARTLGNLILKEKECWGEILDIGGGSKRASHYRFLKLFKWHHISTVDINPDAKPDVVMDMEHEPLPFSDGTYDFVFAFNILEHIANREKVVGEVCRVLKNGGELVGSIPFLVNVHPDPNDYVRMTAQQLEILFKDAGFSSVAIKPAARGPFMAAFSQIEFLMPRFIKLAVLPVVFLLDYLLGLLKPKGYFQDKFPLAYVFYAKK